MAKRGSRRNLSSRKKRRSKFKFETFSISEEDHPKLKAAMREDGYLAAVADFPKTLELVKDKLRHHDPVGIMACFAGYGLLSCRRDQRTRSNRKPFKDIEQHHAELPSGDHFNNPTRPLGVRSCTYRTSWRSSTIAYPNYQTHFYIQRMIETEKDLRTEQELAIVLSNCKSDIRIAHDGRFAIGRTFGSVMKILKELYSHDG